MKLCDAFRIHRRSRVPICGSIHEVSYKTKFKVEKCIMMFAFRVCVQWRTLWGGGVGGRFPHTWCFRK